jgi:hypothetical protein
MSWEIIALEVYFHFIYLSIYFLAVPMWLLVGTQGGCQEGLLGELFPSACEWTPARSPQPWSHLFIF